MIMSSRGDMSKQMQWTLLPPDTVSNSEGSSSCKENGLYSICHHFFPASDCVLVCISLSLTLWTKKSQVLSNFNHYLWSILFCGITWKLPSNFKSGAFPSPLPYLSQQWQWDCLKNWDTNKPGKALSACCAWGTLQPTHPTWAHPTGPSLPVPPLIGLRLQNSLHLERKHEGKEQEASGAVWMPGWAFVSGMLVGWWNLHTVRAAPFVLKKETPHTPQVPTICGACQR